MFKTTNNKNIQCTKVFNTYWRFAFERQSIFMKRAHGESYPWTNDSILSSYKFTNVYRASDRVSQYLIKNVIYKGSQNYEEVFFRTLLFKFFNKIETWEYLVNQLNSIPSWKTFRFNLFDKILTNLSKENPIYSQAYMMPSPNFNEVRKHQNHLLLLKYMMKNKLPSKVINSKSLKDVYSLMREQNSFGDFLAFQYTIDLNYSEIIDFNESDFVVAGVGAVRGIHKCFNNIGKKDYEQIIYKMAEISNDEFKRLNLPFQNLFGRDLKPIDCQNIFCEVDKYSRVAFPEILSSRKKIKQKFNQKSKHLPQWYPPKWKLHLPKINTSLESEFNPSVDLSG